MFLIYSREHNAWWRHARAGYTFDPLEAGLYSEAEAREIVFQANRFADLSQGPQEFCYPMSSQFEWTHHVS